jgi:hypothetical protein
MKRSLLVLACGALFASVFASAAEMPRHRAHAANSDELWARTLELFPGHEGQDAIVMPGGELKVILSKVVPDIDRYLDDLIESVDTIAITHDAGRINVDLWLDPKEFNFKIREKKKAEYGQVYGAKLNHHLHFDISASRDSISIHKIDGLVIYTKLPLLPDSVYPKGVKLDTATEMIILTAKALGITVIGKADARDHKFLGMDWLETLMINWSLFLSLFSFGG